MRAVEKIERWLNERGYELEPGREYCCYWDEKRVTYRPHDRKSTVLNGLLHECGHVLVARSITRPAHAPRYKRGYPSERTHKARPNISAADVVHEEIEAWHRGYLLARRLGIRLDVDAYWRDYGYCIKRYFRRMIGRKV